MSDEKDENAAEAADSGEMIAVQSTRFGTLEVPKESVIEFPAGMIGFPRYTRYIMLEHKPPFSWLQSLDEPDLAFVVVDGFEFGDSYRVKPPQNDKDVPFAENDEFAILVIVTVRPNPADTTANLKAPLFVNVEMRKGVQVIFDNPNFSTRFPLWAQDEEGAEESGEAAKEGDASKEEKKEE